MWRAGGVLAATIPALSWLFVRVRVWHHEVAHFPTCVTLRLTRVTLGWCARESHKHSMLVPSVSAWLTITDHRNSPNRRVLAAQMGHIYTHERHSYAFSLRSKNGCLGGSDR